MKKVYTILVCLCMLAGFVACEKDKDFVLTTLTVTNETVTPSYETAEVSCSFKADATISEAYVQYSLSSGFAKYDVAKMTEEKGKYVALLTDLVDNTTYYIRYAVSNKYSSVVTEEVVECQTLPCTVPTIVLDSIGEVRESHAKAYLHLTFDGGASVTDIGICWSKQANPTIEDIHKSTKDTVAVLDITDLQENTKYYVRAYAVNKVGVSYSEEKTFTTSNEIVLPTVTTAAITQITETSAVAGGNVTSDGGAEITERGVVYATTQNPTTADNKVSNGSGMGTFTCNLTDLQPNTKYYVRAYAINSKGTAYGEEVTFTANKQVVLPSVITAAITQITETSAVAGGNVTSDGGASVTERGVVYSTNPNPVITNLNNTIRPCGSGTGAFTYNMTGLQSGTTYYVRAYAKNDAGTAYGEEVSFTTKEEMVDNPPSNLVAMPFSVSADKQVTFSQGNLQYTQSTDTWSFAESQLDMIGTDNVTGGSVSSGEHGDTKLGDALADKVDLFGWSTSATNFGVSTSENDSDYSGSFVDWGTNKIGNDAPNTWRTLTYNEWYYLRWERPNYSELCGVAQVNGVNGLILLPDSWTCPAGVTFKSGFHSEWAVDYYAAYQTFTADQWSKLEAAGAVFLPASGYRFGSVVSLVQGSGDNWSATEYDSDSAYYFFFRVVGAGIDYNSRYAGRSVRLVKDIEGGGTTPDTPTNTENGYEYVDLGLPSGLMWATCNVGANNPEDYGDYFAWGETTTKDTYYWSTYRYCNGDYDFLTKYCDNSSHGNNGFTDNKTQLELSDDAARANWGGSWRMPTYAEWTELIHNCTWTWTTQNGVYGRKVTSKTNGNSIFLPAAGYRYYSSLDYGAGSDGEYWSSSLITDDPCNAWSRYFGSGSVSMRNGNRCYGLSVRPVCP